jgi:uncharacterized protein (TIGR04255 family)
MKRVKYKNSPLKEVIFQLRFPTILAINAKEPVEFQERLRDEYPLYSDNIEQNKERLPNGEINETQSHRYQFVSADGQYMVSMSSSFIALSTLNYTRWEEFREKIKSVVTMFQDVYRTNIFVRIGLRYKDVITKTRYGFSGKHWNELVKPVVIGIISDIDEENALEYHLVSVHKQKGDETMERNQFEFVLVDGSQEVSLLLDCDYYLTKVFPKDAYLDIADTLHGHSSNFIENSITPALREAMQPEAL